MSGASKRRWRERARMRERVHWSTTEFLICLDVGEVLARNIHNHKRVKIDVRFQRDVLGLLGGQCCRHHRLLRPWCKRPRSCATQKTEEIPSSHAHYRFRMDILTERGQHQTFAFDSKPRHLHLFERRAERVSAT